METGLSFLDTVVDDINKNVSLQDVVSHYLPELRQQSGHYVALCPFHPDTSVGSFKVTPGKNLWKCFACGASGVGGISFTHKYLSDVEGLRTSYKDAILITAKEHGIITESQYKKQSKRQYSDDDILRIKNKHEVQKKDENRPKKADIMTCHYVYASMLKVCELTPMHIEHLMNERKLSRRQIDEEYFSFPDARRNPKFLSKLKQALIDEVSQTEYGVKVSELRDHEPAKYKELVHKVESMYEQLPYVPGFYRDDKGVNRWAVAHGIGMVVRDTKGIIRGVQVRQDSLRSPGAKRYIWFSSSFAYDENDPKNVGGTSPGTPGGVIYPKGDGHKAICITEGKFKAEKIAEKGNIAVYVSGVGTWRNVIDYILELTAGVPQTVYLMFDADMLGNTSVHNQFKAFATELKRHSLKVGLIAWKKERGKGFDDLVNDNEDYTKYLKRISFKSFEVGYEATLQNVLKQMKVSSTYELKTEKERRTFVDALQHSMEAYFELV